MLPGQTQDQMKIVMTNDNTADFAIDEIRIFLHLVSKYLQLRITDIIIS
jgi:predicted DNA-binding transcriptional regulator